MLVPAWDTRTGEKLPNDVPKHWLDSKLFPHLVGSQGAATRAMESAQDPTPDADATADDPAATDKVVVAEPGKAPETTGRKAPTNRKGA